MFKKLFEDSLLMGLPTLSMVLFLIIFLVAVTMIYQSRRRQHYDRMSQLPMDEDTASPMHPRGGEEPREEGS